MAIIPHPLAPNGGFHVDDTLLENIKELPKRCERDKDVVGLIVGDSGTGKSTIASHIGYIFNQEIINQNIYFSKVEDFINYCMKLKESNNSFKQVVIHDEARETGGMNVLNKRIRLFWDFLFENRYLNMFMLLLQSDFFTTPKSIIKGRVSFLIRVREGEGWTNGIYEFYSRPKLKQLYFMGKKLDNEDLVKPDFRGRFVSFFAGNPNYKEEKNNNFLKKYSELDKQINNKYVTKYTELENRILNDRFIGLQDKCRLLDCHERTVQRKKKAISASDE